MKHNYRNLKIWISGMDMVDLVYDFMDQLPKDERYNLISQSVRSACSVPANIAEGSAKISERDFRRYLQIALGSSYELETHLLICQRRMYGNPENLDKILSHIDEQQRMIYGMINSLSSRILKDTAKKTTLILLLLSSVWLLASHFSN